MRRLGEKEQFNGFYNYLDPVCTYMFELVLLNLRTTID